MWVSSLKLLQLPPKVSVHYSISENLFFLPKSPIYQPYNPLNSWLTTKLMVSGFFIHALVTVHYSPINVWGALQLFSFLRSNCKAVYNNHVHKCNNFGMWNVYNTYWDGFPKMYYKQVLNVVWMGLEVGVCFWCIASFWSEDVGSW